MRRGEMVCVQITGVNMASQEDDNKLESKSNINKEQERNFINVYKKFEYILKSKVEPFSKKIESLIEIWKSLSQCNQENSDIGYIIQIMDWAKLHTLNIVLTAKWKMFKADFEAKLLSEVEKTQNELMKISDVFSKKFQKLADVIKNPWDDPVLANLLHDNSATIGQKEIEFFCVETAYLVSVRLKKLCESQCEDLALNLVTAFMNCYNLSQTQNFSLNATKTHILFCFDIHVALLYRYNRKSDIVTLFKKLSLEEGLHLIKRFAKKRVRISKVWRNYPDITFLASQVFVTAAVTKAESGPILKELLDAWIMFSIEHSMIDKVEVSIRRIIQAATAAQHIYICCEIIHEKFGLKLRTFTIELYIRALTTDMNNLESQKSENDSVKIEETTKRLANGFTNLADILNDNVQVSRECALTAFSLQPTLERLKKIEDLARLSGFNVLDTGQIWECKLHPPLRSSDEVSWVCNTCGKWMSKPNLDLRLTTNFALNEALNFETLGISSQLCDDLAVVLNGPRYHLLSWLLRWEDLHRLCEMYLNDMERTKNLVTELKFVDIDYSMFATVKREPVDELAGIERGYESYLYNDEKFGVEEPPDLPPVKSDPDTLKSLRMFRHNIKRNRTQNLAEPHNFASNSQNDWFGANQFGYSPPIYQQQFNRSLNDVFFNHLNHRNPANPIDYSTTSRNVKNEAGKAIFDLGNPKDLSYLSSDNFLHDMITFEFTRVSSEMNKRNGETSKPVTYPKQADLKFKNDRVNRQNCYKTEPKHHSLTKYKSDKLLPHSINSIKKEDEEPQTHKYETSKLICNSVNSVFSQVNLIKDFKDKEAETIAPSRGFPSFDKIPPPPSDKKISPADFAKFNMKRSTTQEMDNIPEKKVKVEPVSPLNGYTLTEHDIDKNRIIKALLSQDDSTNKEQNENSSKNANCCLPTTNNNQFTKLIKLKNVFDLEKSPQNCNGRTDIKHDDAKSAILDALAEKCTQNIEKREKKEAERESPKETKTKTNKELKIILHRLSDEVIKSFIPSHSSPKTCNCTYKKKSVTKSRRVSSVCCKYNIKNTTVNRVLERMDYSIRNLRNGDKKKPKRKFPNCDKRSEKDKKIDNMNPRVVLERLQLDSDYVRSVLSNVPGLNDYEMMRPSNVNHIVNVVQIGGRSASGGTQNTQTSTQISPHIQRVGQPRSDKPEHNSTDTTTTTATVSTTATTTKPSTSQPSTLINILSQQIIRPGQSNCVRSRGSPLINILSQQIIRPATQQKAQSDGQANAPVKVEFSQDEEAKAANSKSPPSSAGQGTIFQFICKSGLPKFQQAFGKTVYQNMDGSETTTTTATTTTTTTTTTTADDKKAKTTSVNIQPIQGGVIYTRQMPVGQTINLIPPGRGQVFRIAAASNSDQILVKDTVIHGKMSALLAAALQGKQKVEDGESSHDEKRPTLVQNARIVKPVLQIPSNVIRTPQSNLSSTTLEQLREFDMVYKQIKERSSTAPSTEATTEPETSQRISVTYVNQGQKYTQISPVVVVSSYCSLQPAASPALSVTSQGSSSPCVTPAPTTSSASTVTKVAKSSKGKTLKNNTTQASKSSPIPKPQQKPQEDEHTTQRIFDILAEYAEQLRNSPDLNNKPAPRRRSNPPTNPNQNSKRKKNSAAKKTGQCSNIISDVDIEDRTVGSEDSSCGVVQISVPDEETHAVTTESNDSTTSRQLILTDSGGTNQTRNLIIADSSVGEALKMPNTAVLVPGNYIMPVSMVKGGQQIAVVSGGSKILATVPARSGPNMLLFQSFLNQNRTKTGLPTVKYSTIQPISGISSQNLGVSGQPPVILPPTAVTLGQPLTLKKVEEPEAVNAELLLTISQPSNGSSETHPDSTNSISSTVPSGEEEASKEENREKVFHTFQKSVTGAVATPVIAQVAKEEQAEQNSAQNSITLNIASDSNKGEPGKALERVQSVLVTACTSNGPMLSHSTPPRYHKPSESSRPTNDLSNKEEFLHNGEKQNNNESSKQYTGNYYQNKNKKGNNPARIDREMHQLCLQRKQAALERELRLQKSLSEECEDLGVDEPSTSDLFPEADILFDANHSPSFDQSPQEPKRSQESKEKSTLFSDDENSDFLFGSIEYQPSGTVLVYEPESEQPSQQLTNGQSESASSCEDHTLLQNCASMSDVTLNSPVSPEYHESASNKYKFKYSNRRKGPKPETWTVEVSSSEDTTGSGELAKSPRHADEEMSVVTVAILKEGECEAGHEEEELDSASGRGARRSVKKMCSCCNGAQEHRKRPASRPQTPAAPHKKAFISKKR